MKLKNIAIASALIAGSVLAIQASANPVTASYGGVTYTLVASDPYAFNAYSSTLQAQPWWNDGTMALNIIQQVTNQLGLYTSGGGSGNLSPLAAYAANSSVTTVAWYSSNSGGSSNNGSGPSITAVYRWLLASGYYANNSVDLAPNAHALRSIYNTQSAALNAGLSYDCNMFDKQGFCLSTGGRYSTTNSPETATTSGLLIGSYKYDKNIRLGAWVDQNLSTNNTTGMTLSNSNPLFGVFGAWAERNDGLGYEVKVSAGYGDKDVTVTRSAANQGTSQIRMRGISTVSSYGFAIDGGLIASPYAGVKYTSINRGAYTEGGSGALTYDNLRQESVTVVAGAKLAGKIDSQTGFVLSAGVEHDLNHNVGQYSAGSSNTTAFNSKVQKTRPVVTAGVFYDIDKTQRIGLNAIHRQEAFQTTTSTTALATYTVGF